MRVCVCVLRNCNRNDTMSRNNNSTQAEGTRGRGKLLVKLGGARARRARRGAESERGKAKGVRLRVAAFA